MAVSAAGYDFASAGGGESSGHAIAGARLLHPFSLREPRG
jgi:hypothetical protein